MRFGNKNEPSKPLLLAAFGVLIWAISGVATAQDKVQPAERGKAVQAKRPEAKARPGATAAQPGARKGRLGIQRPAIRGVTPTARRKQAVPKPTVVLKSGEVPAIKFDTPVYDFGRVRAGKDIRHEFWFTNTGTGPLEILKVKPG